MRASNILISVSNNFIFEAIKYLLTNEQDTDQRFIIKCKSTIGSLTPDIILTDYNSIDQKLLSQYPEAKIILIDTGLKQKDIISILSSYKIYGFLSINTNINLFKKALEVVNNGRVWIDNNTIKMLLHKEDFMSEVNKIDTITEREKEIIEYVSLGCTNKEIASRLSVSEQTVKAHLNRIFRKFNVSNRSKLVALTSNFSFKTEGILEG